MSLHRTMEHCLTLQVATGSFCLVCTVGKWADGRCQSKIWRSCHCASGKWHVCYDHCTTLLQRSKHLPCIMHFFVKHVVSHLGTGSEHGICNVLANVPAVIACTAILVNSNSRVPVCKHC